MDCGNPRTRDGVDVQQPRDPGDRVQSPLPLRHQDGGPGVQDLEDGGGEAQVLDQVETES